jgi:hypothetical protein
MFALVSTVFQYSDSIYEILCEVFADHDPEPPYGGYTGERYGVGMKGAKERQYCAKSYYSEEHKRLMIHFTVFWNTKVHNKVCMPVYEYYYTVVSRQCSSFYINVWKLYPGSAPMWAKITSYV